MLNASTVVFQNFYECSQCGTIWTDEWDCMCDHRCPNCNAETEPYHSIEIGPPPTS
jgi:rubrerythrin